MKYLIKWVVHNYTEQVILMGIKYLANHKFKGIKQDLADEVVKAIYSSKQNNYKKA